MKELFKDIIKEVVISGKQGPRIYFEPFVFIFKTFRGQSKKQDIR